MSFDSSFSFLSSTFDAFIKDIDDTELRRLRLEPNELSEIFQPNSDEELFSQSFLELFGFSDPNNLNQAQIEFEDRIIGALTKMPKSQLMAFFKFLNLVFHRNGKKFTLKVEDLYSEKILVWIKLYVELLGVFQNSKNQAPAFETPKPFNQCYWCGKYQNWKKKHFRFCHNAECSNSGNSGDHVNCCQGHWLRLKTKTKKKLKLAKAKNDKQAAIDAFNSFLKECLELCLNNPNKPRIRTIEDFQIEEQALRIYSILSTDI